jgi:hypothetical protein
MLNTTLLAPPGTVTLEGTVATAELLLASDTEMPPLGATPFSFTVPLELLPPMTLAGTTVSDVNDGPVTVSVADRKEPPLLAVLVTGVEDETGTVVTLNVALVAPAETLMLDGAVATDELLEVRDTLIPAAYAGPVSVTVP